jgi:hypothetical protein
MSFIYLVLNSNMEIVLRSSVLFVRARNKTQDRQAVWLSLSRLVTSGLHGASVNGSTDKSLNCSLPVNFNCPFGQIYGFWLAIKLTAEKTYSAIWTISPNNFVTVAYNYCAVKFFATLHTSLSLMLIGTYSDRDNHSVRGHRLVFSVLITWLCAPLRILVSLTAEASCFMIHLLKEPE